MAEIAWLKVYGAIQSCSAVNEAVMQQKMQWQACVLSAGCGPLPKVACHATQWVQTLVVHEQEMHMQS